MITRFRLCEKYEQLIVQKREVKIDNLNNTQLLVMSNNYANIY